MYKIYAKIRDEKGLKDADIARTTGIPRSNLSMWKNGTHQPKYDKMCRIADALGVSVEYLMTGGKAAPTVQSGVSIPILGFVAAGVPIAVITDYIGEVTISPHLAKKGEHFALKIKGDSMAPDMRQGDIVVVRSQQTAESGDIVVVQVDGDEATCKRIQLTDDGMILQPLNPNYQPTFFSADKVRSLPVTIIGKVIEVRRTYE